MALTVNDVLAIRLEFRGITAGEQYIMSTHWRINAGEIEDKKENWDALILNISEGKAATFLENLPETVGLFRISAQKLAPVKGPSWFQLYTPSDRPGALELGVGNINAPIARAAGTLTRVSYLTGRKSYGRTFFGPLAAQFIGANNLVIDPTGNGDLNDVASALFDPFSVVDGTSSITLRPIICNQAGTGVTAQNDVRRAYWQPYVTYLKTRAVGRGG